MTIANESTMRRIAIVLASLPEPVAQRLLGSLHSDSQRSIRAALGSLSDVDPLERRRALDGFANSLRKGRSAGNNHDDAAEIVFSRAAIRSLKDPSQGTNSNDNVSGATSGTAPAANTRKPPAPLAFLLDVDDETMVAHLSGEMPQTLAIILASISPAQAARVLPRLDVTVRTEAMRRMANLKELPSELIDDIGNQLRHRLKPTQSTSRFGRVALDAILAEMPQEIPQRDNSPVENSQRDNSQRSETLDSPRRNVEANTSSTVAEGAITTMQPSVKLAEGTWPDNGQGESRNVVPPNDDLDERNRAASPLASTDAIHSYLMSLPIDRLRDSLAKVATRTALLTLCGLPNAKAEAVLASLPRRQSKQVRDQLSQLGALELRDIDQAKEAVATLALGARPVVSASQLTVAA